MAQFPNQYYAVRRGEKHHAAKLTDKDVKQMRFLHEEEGLCTKCIAKVYQINYQTAYDAITYRSWRHVR